MRIDRRSNDQNALIIEIANKFGREAARERFNLTPAQLTNVFKSARKRERKQSHDARALAANVEASA